MTERAVATLTKWGNGQGLLIPKRLCQNLGIELGDKLKITATEESITIVPIRERARRTRWVTIEELFVGYDGTYEPPNDWPTDGDEIDWGEPEGGEVW